MGRFVGHASELAMGGVNGSDPFVRVYQAKDINPPSPKAGTVGAYDNDTNAVIKLPTSVDFGQCTAACNYDAGNAQHQQIFSMVGKVDQIVWWRLKHSDTAATPEWFQGWVEEFGRQHPSEGVSSGSLVIAVVGASQFTPPA